MTKELSKFIKQDPHIQGGMPVISGTRVTVAEIVDYLETERNIRSVITVLRKAGVLVTEEEVSAALAFAKYRSSFDEKDSKERSQ